MRGRQAAPIIDAHCHAGPGDGFTGPWDTVGAAGVVPASVRRGRHRPVEPAGRVPLRLRGRERGGRPDRRRPPRPVLRLRVRARRARPRPDPADGPAGGARSRLLRHQGAPARRPASAGRSATSRGGFRLPVLYDVMGEVAAAELLADRVPGRRLHHPAPGQFRRRLERAAGVRAGRWPSGPNVFTDTSGVRRFDLLEQAVRRAGPHEGAVRLRRPVAASGSRAGEDPAAGACRRRRSRWSWPATSCGSPGRRGPAPPVGTGHRSGCRAGAPPAGAPSSASASGPPSPPHPVMSSSWHRGQRPRTHSSSRGRPDGLIAPPGAPARGCRRR